MRPLKSVMRGSTWAHRGGRAGGRGRACCGASAGVQTHLRHHAVQEVVHLLAVQGDLGALEMPRAHLVHGVGALYSGERRGLARDELQNECGWHSIVEPGGCLLSRDLHRQRAELGDGMRVGVLHLGHQVRPHHDVVPLLESAARHAARSSATRAASGRRGGVNLRGHPVNVLIGAYSAHNHRPSYATTGIVIYILCAYCNMIRNLTMYMS